MPLTLTKTINPILLKICRARQAKTNKPTPLTLDGNNIIYLKKGKIVAETTYHYYLIVAIGGCGQAEAGRRRGRSSGPVRGAGE